MLKLVPHFFISLLVPLWGLGGRQQHFYRISAQAALVSQAYNPDAQRQPQFPGDMNALTDYMQKNVRYPEAAQKAKVTGRVFTSFIVERDGRLTDIKVLKGLGSGCDEEAIRVINTMPRWKPGTQSGIPIRVKYNLPITFGVPYPKIRE